MKKKKKENFNYYLFIITIYLLIFQNIIETFFQPMKYFDEVLSLLCIPIIVITLIKKKQKTVFKKDDLIMLLLLFSLYVIGMYSSLKYMYQPIDIALSDSLLVFKFFLVYIMSNHILTEEYIELKRFKINKHIKFIVILLFFLTICNYVFKVWPVSNYRFGIMTNKLFYGHPTNLSAICIFLISLLILTSKKESKNHIYIFFLFIILLSTLRFKAIGAAIIVLLIIIYIKRTNKKLSLGKVGFLGVIAILLVWNSISYYYISFDGSARKVLNDTSIEIAKDYFPIGTGFGTFGSYFSTVSYSPIYLKYGINNIYGLTNGNAIFVSDTFWPMIIGQFGIIGTICYILLIFHIYRKIQNEYDFENTNMYIAKMICFIYLIISSTSESSFVNPISIPLALIIGINIFNKKGLINEEK